MMDWSTLPIALAYFALGGLVVFFVLRTRMHVSGKIAVLILVPATSFVVWRAISSYQGWPTAAPTPAKAIMLWGAVREPNPHERDPGAIYLWLVPLERKLGGRFAYDPTQAEPRAYRLTYTRSRHRAVEAAKASIAQGHPVILDRKGDVGQERLGKEGDQEGQSMSGYESDEEDDMPLYRLPPPTLPQKNE